MKPGKNFKGAGAAFFVPETAGAMICLRMAVEPQKGHSTRPRAA